MVLCNPPSAPKPSVCLGRRTLKNYNSCQRRKRLPGVPCFLYPRGERSQKHITCRTLSQVPGGTKERLEPWLKRDKKELMCAFFFFNMFFTLSQQTLPKLFSQSHFYRCPAWMSMSRKCCKDRQMSHYGGCWKRGSTKDEPFFFLSPPGSQPLQNCMTGVKNTEKSFV